MEKPLRKRGDTREDGRVFWARIKKTGREIWMPRERFEQEVVKARERAVARLKKNPEKVRAAKAAYRAKNPEKCRASVATWAAANRERKLKTNADWYAANRERLRAVRRAWEERNKDKRRALSQAQDVKRREDPRLLSLKRIRMRLNYVVDRVKASKLVTRADCHEAADFLAWCIGELGLQDLSGYQVDHLVPLCSFDLANPEEARRSNAPENVRWLPAEQNQAKADRMPTPEEVSSHLLLVQRWREARSGEGKKESVSGTRIHN